MTSKQQSLTIQQQADYWCQGAIALRFYQASTATIRSELLPSLQENASLQNPADQTKGLSLSYHLSDQASHKQFSISCHYQDKHLSLDSSLGEDLFEIDQYPKPGRLIYARPVGASLIRLSSNNFKIKLTQGEFLGEILTNILGIDMDHDIPLRQALILLKSQLICGYINSDNSQASGFLKTAKILQPYIIYLLNQAQQNKQLSKQQTKLQLYALQQLPGKLAKALPSQQQWLQEYAPDSPLDQGLFGLQLKSSDADYQQLWFPLSCLELSLFSENMKPYL